MTHFDSFVNGLLLSAVASLLSSAIALWGFRRTYHLSILLCAFSAVYALAAWIIYTRKNPVGFRAPKASPTGKKTSGDNQATRMPENGSQRNGRVRSFLMNPIPALLWSALQLFILTVLLYTVFDIGATYYR